MNVLIIGGGGREHALAWKAAQSEMVSRVYVVPGNGGTASEPKVSNVAINPLDIEKLVAFARDSSIALTIVGPEMPLSKGIVDNFMQADLPIFGPTAAAAQLETSKVFAKDFLSRHDIPTAEYAAFSTIEPAKAYIRRKGAPIVVKADGLASGKGVIVAQTVEEACEAAEVMLSGKRFGHAGQHIIVEEFLEGDEASFIVMVDGKNIQSLATSQDHKARNDGDKGPNTGGMGACSPAPIVTQAQHNKIMKSVIYPAFEGLKADGITYTGFLYAGLMITKSGDIKVLEFNCRFGDPETQSILMRLESDLVEHCLAATKGQLNTQTIRWSAQAAVSVVIAAGGYPSDYNQGDLIGGIENVKEAKVFHAGTCLKEDKLFTAGGRVLAVTALGDTISQAREMAYDGVRHIFWQNSFYRSDIGLKAEQQESSGNY